MFTGFPELSFMTLTNMLPMHCRPASTRSTAVDGYRAHGAAVRCGLLTAAHLQAPAR